MFYFVSLVWSPMFGLVGQVNHLLLSLKRKRKPYSQSSINGARLKRDSSLFNKKDGNSIWRGTYMIIFYEKLKICRDDSIFMSRSPPRLTPDFIKKFNLELEVGDHQKFLQRKMHTCIYFSLHQLID